MDKIIGWAIIIVIGGGALWGIATFVDNRQAKSDCKNRAAIAAAETYPMNEYPDTAQRGTLQDTYEQRYLETCN